MHRYKLPRNASLLGVYVLKKDPRYTVKLYTAYGSHGYQTDYRPVQEWYAWGYHLDHLVSKHKTRDRQRYQAWLKKLKRIS